MITKVISVLFYGIISIKTVLFLSSIYNSISITNGEAVDTSSHFERIINGHLAPVGTFQFQVSVTTDHMSAEGMECGGVIVSAFHVLTAAHCVQNLNDNTTRKMRSPSSIIVGGGSVSFLSRNMRYFEVREVIVHERYNYNIDVDYDMAILKLRTRLPVHIQGFKGIKLINKEVPAGTKCVISGWGVAEKDNNPFNLKYTFNYIINREKCQQMLQNTSARTVTPRMICVTYNKENPSSSCQGDSGGPLVCEGRLVGITSYGVRQIFPNGTEATCAYAYPVTVFTSIFNLRSWILSKLEAN